MNEDIWVGIALLLVLWGAFEIGLGVGKRRSVAAPASGGASGPQLGAIQGALLGLLGLLLAFSFAAAATRFLERQDLIVTEANAIGTTYLRTDLIDEPHRSVMRQGLRDYVTDRIRLSKLAHRGMTDADLVQAEALQKTLWQAAIEGLKQRPAAIVALLDPLNEMIDLQTLRLAAGRKHVPMPVLGVLIVCAVLSMLTLGYGSGVSGGRRNPLSYALVVVVGATLFLIIDLDFPRAGLMQLSDLPLESLKLE